MGEIVFTPGGPNEETVQLSVDADQLLEFNETYLLRLQLPDASIAVGAQIGKRNEARVTIINDDSKISHDSLHHTYYKQCFSEIQVFFMRQISRIRELEQVIIPVGFSPQKTNIPFTVRVETFDLSPSSAQGSV